ncbi:hypothetical protein [Gordonia sp. DT101]
MVDIDKTLVALDEFWVALDAKPPARKVLGAKPPARKALGAKPAASWT